VTPSRPSDRSQRPSLTSRRLAAAAGSALFFASAPAVVAGAVPWLLTHWRAREPFPGVIALQFLGALLVASATIVLVAAFVRFVIEGLGTPAPVAPTDQLVVGGLYRRVRNPMYPAVIAIVVGQALILGRPVLLGYAATIGLAMAAFVRGYEEPALARQFADQYECYRRHVPRWRPRLRAWDPTNGSHRDP
jgi:protein-S-isoprenylcysteine O-methyltransferase Ste14